MKTIEYKTPDGRLQYSVVENKHVFLRKTLKWVNHEPIYEKGKPVKCSCKYDGKNAETATAFIYENGRMYCPDCNKEIEITKTVEDMQIEAENEEKARIEREIKARENVHLCFVDQSISSGLQYYELSTRVEYETWNKIKDLFFYMTYDDDDEEQDTFGMTKLTGWLTTQPGKVEERLNVKPEQRLDYRNKKASERKEKINAVKKERDEVKKQIEDAFKPENVKRPWADESIKGTQGASMIPWPDGKVYEDPKYPFDIYGGGRKWVINKKLDVIWEITNNGHDGDNWGLNNIATGGAGAIGVYVPYSEELELLIKNYIKLCENVGEI